MSEKVKATREDRWSWQCPKCQQYNDQWDEPFDDKVYCESCEEEFLADFEP